MNRGWYFDGYESKLRPAQNGKKARRELVYTGEYYGLSLPAGSLRRLKRGFALAYAVFAALFVVLSLLPTACARSLWVSLPLLAVLFPMIFLGMGLACFLRAGEKWPKRLVRSIYHRLRWSSLLSALLLLICIAGDIAAFFRTPGRFLPEALYLLGLLVMLAVPLIILYYQRKYPVKLLDPS